MSAERSANVVMWIGGALAVVVVGALLGGAVMGARMISAEREACEAIGGVHVKQYNGFACIKAQKVTP